jgi:hypothetical protein
VESEESEKGYERRQRRVRIRVMVCIEIESGQKGRGTEGIPSRMARLIANLQKCIVFLGSSWLSRSPKNPINSYSDIREDVRAIGSEKVCKNKVKGKRKRKRRVEVKVKDEDNEMANLF